MSKILVTGSSGLIGSEVVKYFSAIGYEVHGVDNNQRAVFFGIEGDNRWNQKLLEETVKNFHHHEIDIRNRAAILDLINSLRPNAIIHAAAQPSHDLAAKIPFDDFETNAVGTLNLLESVRRYCKDSIFIYMSTNKVYGDRPNDIKLIEKETRWDYDDQSYLNGIPESFSIDQSKHSIFGASKLSADILVQEYGRYFDIPTCCLRGGCLTGPNHSGVKMHGFLSYLVKTNLEKKKYSIIGYKGKQVRDNIHSWDVANFIFNFITNPRIAEVYNIGGGKQNSCSIIEAISLTESITGFKQDTEYVSKSRIGDHICYYSDLSKMKEHYPNWDITVSLEKIITEITNSWKSRI